MTFIYGNTEDSARTLAETKRPKSAKNNPKLAQPTCGATALLPCRPNRSLLSMRVESHLECPNMSMGVASNKSAVGANASSIRFREGRTRCISRLTVRRRIQEDAMLSVPLGAYSPLTDVNVKAQNNPLRIQ